LPTLSGFQLPRLVFIFRIYLDALSFALDPAPKL